MHRGPTRSAAGRPWLGIAAALALALLLAAGPPPLPVPPGGDDLAPTRSGAVAGGNGATGQAILPAPATDAAPPRATGRVLRAGAERGPGAAPPPDAPPPWPALAAEGPGTPGAPPVLAPADRDAFHPRLVGIPRAPTGPPARRA